MITLENYDEFGIVLSNRFHTILSHLENISGNFTAFIQAINRSDSTKLKQKTLSYIGLEEQKRRLTNSGKRIAFDSDSEEDRAWTLLGKTDFREITIESYTFYNNFKKGNLRIQDVHLRSLKDYFNVSSNDPQRAEHIILSKYFDIESAYFVTLPLIQFGDFDGLVYVVFDNQDQALYENEGVKIRIIKTFSIEYEKLLLEWKKTSFEDENEDLNSHLSFLQSNEYYELINTNPILISLNFKQYYLDSNDYYRSTITRLSKALNKKFQKRLNLKNEVSTNWEMSELLRTAFHQFLIYFSDYAKNIHNVEINIKIEQTPEGLRLTSMNNFHEEIVLVDNLLSQYLEIFLTQSYSVIEKSLKDDIKKFHYNQSIRELKLENEILKLKIEGLLEKQEIFNSILNNNETLHMKANFFKIPHANSIVFSKYINELDIHYENNLNKKDLKDKIFKEARINIEKGETSSVLSMLGNYFESTKAIEELNQISVLKANLKNLKKEKNSGTVKEDEYSLLHNKIINTILNLIS